jgi:uncharacterized repeat protein (TIGR04042 family)
MPEMHFRVRWPDESETRCYSPSLVIRDFFEPGRSYALGDFLGRSRQALSIASERVRAKYGRPCSLALGQLNEIERLAQAFEAGAQVHIIDFD